MGTRILALAAFICGSGFAYSQNRQVQLEVTALSVAKEIYDGFHPAIARSPGKLAAHQMFAGPAPDDAVHPFLQSAHADKRTKVIAAPKLVAQHGKPARFFTGGQIANTANGPEGRLDFRHYGTTFEFTPLVRDSGRVYVEAEVRIRSDNSRADEQGMRFAFETMPGESFVMVPGFANTDQGRGMIWLLKATIVDDAAGIQQIGGIDLGATITASPRMPVTRTRFVRRPLWRR